MYGSSLIRRQWQGAIARIDDHLAHEHAAYGMDYMTDIDDLLDQRNRLSNALKDSGELPMVEAKNWGS